MLSSGIVLLHDNTRPHTAAATKRLLKCFRREVFDHSPPSVQIWLPVILISFLLGNSRRRTTFWHNELQTSVENWLKAQAAGFYDEGIGKLVPLGLPYVWFFLDMSSFSGLKILSGWIFLILMKCPGFWTNERLSLTPINSMLL